MLLAEGFQSSEREKVHAAWISIIMMRIVEADLDMQEGCVTAGDCVDGYGP
jgi:hypothetical protein